MTMSEALSNECPEMSIQEQLEFVRGPLHDGVVTKTLHYAALLPITWWALTGNFWLLVLGIVLPEAGHIYDLLFRFDAHMRARARQVVWLQAVGGVVALIPFVLVYLAVQRV